MEPNLRARLLAGDPDAFGVLFDEHANAVYNLGFRLNANCSAADEVVSVTFLEAWRRRSSIDPGRHPAAGQDRHRRRWAAEPAGAQQPVLVHQAAALIPGVTVVPDAIEAACRHGVAVAYTFRGIRTEWIFSNNTFRYLRARGVNVATGASAGVSAVLRRAFVDQAGQIPG